MNKMLLTYGLNIISSMLPMLSGELRSLLETMARQFYRKAQETENPWDDILAGFLMAMLGLKTK